MIPERKQKVKIAVVTPYADLDLIDECAIVSTDHFTAEEYVPSVFLCYNYKRSI